MQEVSERILKIENGFRHIYEEVNLIIEAYPKSKCYGIALDFYKKVAWIFLVRSIQ